MRLERQDLEAIWDFLVEVDELDADDPYAPPVLARLQTLVASDEAGYQSLDLVARCFIELAPDQADEDEELYWAVGPCPITEYRVRTGDLTAIRMSDVVGRQRYHETPFYREYFAPVGMDHVLDLGLSMDRHRSRSLVLLRYRDEHDFSERDRAVLEMLRPHLRAREARADLRRRVGEVASARDGDDPPDQQARLTAREREILRLVGEGRTNAEIATELWVTPGTVKKHLEHVYDKLGVASRAAAAASVQVSYRV